MTKIQYFKNVLIVIVVVAFSMSAPTLVLANNAKPVQRDSITRVSYIGLQNQLPVVEIQIRSEEASSFLINVKDENGRLLYSEQLNGPKLSRKYALQSNDMDIAGTTFEITNIKSNETNVFRLYLAANHDVPVSVTKVYSSR
jgi:hypothetical protein